MPSRRAKSRRRKSKIRQSQYTNPISDPKLDTEKQVLNDIAKKFEEQVEFLQNYRRQVQQRSLV